MNIPDGMAPFDLDAAKAGAPICYRNGDGAVFNSYSPNDKAGYEVLSKNKSGLLCSHHKSGSFLRPSIDSPEDLFIDKRTQEKKMQPFNLARTQAGDPICNRDGDPMKFVVYEPGAAAGYRVMAMDKVGIVLTYDEVGRAFKNMESSRDLFMAPKKRVVWTRHYTRKDGSIHAATSSITDPSASWFGEGCEWIGPAFKTEYDA